MKRAITIMGPAGSGKSTVAKIVAERLGWHYVSTGRLARGLIGGEWQELGLMAPEKQMREAFEVEIAGHDLVVLDGIPRKPDQVDYLDTLFENVEYYTLEITDAQATRRLLKRGRTDDTDGAIARRLDDYRRITAKALSKAKRRHMVYTIHGDMKPEDIAAYIAEWSK